MTEKLQVPVQVQALGSLLRAGSNRPHAFSTGSYETRFQGGTFVDRERDYLDLLQSHLGSLTPSFEALMVEIVTNPDVREAVLTRRTQAFLDDLVDWHPAAMEVQNLNTHGPDREGASLL